MDEERSSATPTWGAVAVGAPRNFNDGMGIDDDFSSTTDYFEVDMGQLRSTRLANRRSLVIIVTVLTQVVVLASVAMIMGVAVLTMCAVVGEVFVVTLVAAVLERQIVSVTDLATLLEVAITFLVTVITVTLAAIGGAGKVSDGASLAATKFG